MVIQILLVAVAACLVVFLDLVVTLAVCLAACVVARVQGVVLFLLAAVLLFVLGATRRRSTRGDSLLLLGKRLLRFGLTGYGLARWTSLVRPKNVS